MKGASSAKCSLYLLNSISALSLFSAYLSSSIYLMIDYFSSSVKFGFGFKFEDPLPILYIIFALV
jgi:hypothetical protein